MLLYHLSVLANPLSITFINTCNANNERNPASFPFPVTAFINEEFTGCINKEAIGAINKAATGAIIDPRNPSSCLFYFRFYCLSCTIS